MTQRIQTEAALYAWLVERMRQHGEIRPYPESVVELVEFIIEKLPGSITAKQVLEDLHYDRPRPGADEPESSIPGHLLEHLAGDSEETAMSKTLMKFAGGLMAIFPDTIRFQAGIDYAIDLLDLKEDGLIETVEADGILSIQTTEVGREALAVEIAVQRVAAPISPIRIAGGPSAPEMGYWHITKRNHLIGWLFERLDAATPRIAVDERVIYDLANTRLSLCDGRLDGADLNPDDILSVIDWDRMEDPLTSRCGLALLQFANRLGLVLETTGPVEIANSRAVLMLIAYYNQAHEELEVIRSGSLLFVKSTPLALQRHRVHIHVALEPNNLSAHELWDLSVPYGEV